MTPDEIAGRNVALLTIIAAAVVAIAGAGYWLLYSERPIAVRLRAIMSRLRILEADDIGVAEPLPEAPTIERQGKAMPANAINDGLPGNLLPEEVREIIRFQARVEDVIAIIETGKIGQTEAIEAIFHCKRSGRTDSVYGRAHAAVAARLTPAPRYRQYTPEELAVLQPNGHE